MAEARAARHLKDPPDLRDLLNLVASQAPHKCKDIGLQLKISLGELDSICTPNIANASNYYAKIFAAWKSQRRIDYSWGTLISILELPAVGCSDLADVLKTKYKDGAPEPSLPELMNDVAAQVPHKWKDIALQLGTTYAEMEAICPTSLSEINNYYSQIFTIWKSRRKCPYTWNHLIGVLRAAAVGCNDIADNLEDLLH